MSDQELLAGYADVWWQAIDDFTGLLETLGVFLDESGSWNRTAARLHLHVNTVAQRIRRLEELTGLRLSRPKDLLELTAALRVARIAGVG